MGREKVAQAQKNRNQGMCKREKENASVYEYNWTAFPANCCKRIRDNIFLKAGR